jgi:RimJ/RimL family protein N-acetyltransferase
MRSDFTVVTERLRLEPFNLSHFQVLSQMDQDPEIMRYIGNGRLRSSEETRDMIAKVQTRWAEHGFSWWAVSLTATGDQIGSACLQHLENDPSKPLEIGWRLRPAFRGMGYATEAGQAAIDTAFGRGGVDYIMAVTHPENIPSQRVMQRLGMRPLGLQTHYNQDCVTYELARTPGI